MDDRKKADMVGAIHGFCKIWERHWRDEVTYAWWYQLPGGERHYPNMHMVHEDSCIAYLKEMRNVIDDMLNDAKS